MNETTDLDAQIVAERHELDRRLTRLKLIHVLRYVGLPLIAASAAAALVADPVLFPVVATIVGAIIGLGETVARKDRSQLDVLLKDLEARHAVDSKEAQEISFAANNITVAGSSN